MKNGKFRGVSVMGRNLKTASASFLQVLVGQNRQMIMASDGSVLATNKIPMVRFYDPRSGVQRAKVLAKDVNLTLASDGGSNDSVKAYTVACPGCSETLLSENKLRHCLLCSTEIDPDGYEEVHLDLPDTEEILAAAENLDEEDGQEDGDDYCGDSFEEDDDDDDSSDDDDDDDDDSSDDEGEDGDDDDDDEEGAGEEEEGDAFEDGDDEDLDSLDDEGDVFEEEDLEPIGDEFDEDGDLEIDETDMGDEFEDDDEDFEIGDAFEDDDDDEVNSLDDEGDAFDDEDDIEIGDAFEEDEDDPSDEGTDLDDDDDEDGDSFDEELETSDEDQDGDFYVDSEGTVNIDLVDGAELEDGDVCDVEYSASMGGSKRWLVTVNSMPVAYATEDTVGKNKGIFHTRPFGKIVKTVLASSGLSGVKELGFQPIVVAAPVRGLIDNAVRAEVASTENRVAKQLKTMASDFSVSLGVAAAGINRGFFNGVVNPLKLRMWEELSAMKIPQPHRLIDRVFKETAEEYSRILIETAMDFQLKPKDVKVELSRAIAGSNYLTVADSDVEEDEKAIDVGLDSEVEEDDDDSFEESFSKRLEASSMPLSNRGVVEAASGVCDRDDYSNKLKVAFENL